MAMLIALFFLSCIGGFFSGLLGVGGAVVLIPLMLWVPPLVGAGELTMHQVSGMTMVQVLVASFSGCFAHYRNGHVHWNTTLSIGIPMGVFSLLGSAASRYMTEEIMLSIFGCLVVIAFFMLLNKAHGESEKSSNEFTFRFVGSTTAGSLVGLASGIVGAGGGFMVIPLMVRMLKIPMRIAVGSSLGVVFIGAFMGTIGKALTSQIEWVYLLPVIAGSAPAALVGARVSKEMHPKHVRYMLVGVVFFAALNTWKKILGL